MAERRLFLSEGCCSGRPSADAGGGASELLVPKLRASHAAF